MSLALHSAVLHEWNLSGLTHNIYVRQTEFNKWHCSMYYTKCMHILVMQPSFHKLRSGSKTPANEHSALHQHSPQICGKDR